MGLFANTGIPMVCLAVPTMLLALLPIAGVESTFYWKWLKRPFKDAFLAAVSANLWSTVCGVPFTWLLVLVVQISIGGTHAWGMETSRQKLEAVTFQAAWLIPYKEHLAWMVPAASLTLLLPFYLSSVVVEFVVLAARWRTLGRAQLMLNVMFANAWSYLGLGCFYGLELWSRLD